MTPADVLAREGALLGAAVRTAPDAAVPGCPGWDAETLLAHVARVHRWATGFLRDARLGVPCAPAGHPRLPEDEDLFELYDAGLSELVGEVRIADPVRPAWTFAPAIDATAGFWVRRQTMETLVHRIDAESAAGLPTPVDPALAADAVAEALDVIAWRALERGPGVKRGVVEIAGCGRWALEGTSIERSEEQPTVVVRGSAEQSLLGLYGRVPWSDVPADGDVAWLDALAEALRF
jgi:uncharacterized protein (TIGR03083 family)